MTETKITDRSPGEVLAMCMEWRTDMEKTGEWDTIQANIDKNVLRCPIHQHATTYGLCKQTTGGTKKCPICGHYMCPGCSSHAVDIMSRVTGYLQTVSGWNTAKKQEFEDRNRYTLN